MYIDLLDKEKIKTAIKHLAEKDAYLIDIGVNEQSIAHKLAEYLQGEFSEWDVDCEYNRKLYGLKAVDFEYMISSLNSSVRKDVKKDIKILQKELIDKNNYLKDEDGNLRYIQIEPPYVKNIYPDIIIHKRGCQENKIVIELKIKDRSHDSAKNRTFDLLKLAALTDLNGDYKYTTGLLITFPKELKTDQVKIKFTKNKLIKKLLADEIDYNVYEVTVS